MSSSRKQGPTPCAACKLLRRRCAQDECVFAPYFPSDDPHKFATVHRVFGASNVNKLLQELPVQHRADAVNSMVYEANARLCDPVYGCAGAITSLQNQIDLLQAQLAVAQAEVVRMRMNQASSTIAAAAATSSPVSSSKFAGTQKKRTNFNMDLVVDQATVGGEPLWSY